MASGKFGCPRCGGQAVFKRNSDGSCAKLTFDDQGGRVSEEQLVRGSVGATEAICADLHCGAVFIHEHWEKDAKQIPCLPFLRSLLEELARNSGTISYRDLTHLYRRKTGFQIDHRLHWAAPLGALCDEDVRLGSRSLVAALVINEEFGFPGPGFPWATIDPNLPSDDSPASQRRRWQVWRIYKRQVHRYFYNLFHRPWMVKKGK